MKLRKYIPELIVLVYAVLFLFTKNPASEWDRVIVSDGKGYYAYLTAIFIYHDSDYGYIDQYESEYYPASGQLYKDFRFNTGNGIVNKYFPGPAVLWLPFFGVGHAVALLSGFPTDGYSLPYQYSVAFAAFVYFWLALLFLRKILRFYTKDETAIAWSLLTVGLATNLIYYTVNAGCQVHVYDFFLVNVFIYSILQASKHWKPVYYASAAFLLGMIVISRPQNGMIVLALPFLCGSRESFVQFLKRIFTEIRILLVSAVAFAIPILIPILYWFLKTGHPLVYSYGNESFNLTHPHLIAFLFSFEKGWLLYTPVAAFALYGLVYLFRKSRWQFFSLLLFMMLVVYVLSSWWVWTYTSYISQRVMIDYYAFIGILIVFIFNGLNYKRKQILLPVILNLFIGLNIMQYFQQLNWIYPAGPVTAKSYFSNFFSFSRGTTYEIPENEIIDKQTYTTDFESAKPFFNTNGFEFSTLSLSGKNALILDASSNDKPVYIRSVSDFKEVEPIILKIGGYYSPETLDSSLNIEVSIGTYKTKYSLTRHDLIPGLKKNEWKYAEMAVYLPYIRSINDSIFISYQNLSNGKVLLDDLQIEFMKMKGPQRHDWILSAKDPVETDTIFRTDLEKVPTAPWGNTFTISSAQAFSGNQSSCIQLSSPYSVVFEKDLDTVTATDGYFRVSSRISGDSLAEVLLVFDFSSAGKSVFYKTYPVKLSGNKTHWNLNEVFREYPVARLKAQKVKIYYWYTKGTNPVYIDDLQVDMVKYKPAKIVFIPDYAGNKTAETLFTNCCDFENDCKPESGWITEVPDAFSGKKVCMIGSGKPFSFSYLIPLTSLKTTKDAFVYISAMVNTDHYSTNAALVTDFRHNGNSFSYNPTYLNGRTLKGKWEKIVTGVSIPAGITANDSVLVYFYLPETDEAMMIDDFCVSLKKQKNSE